MSRGRCLLATFSARIDKILLTGNPSLAPAAYAKIIERLCIGTAPAARHQHRLLIHFEREAGCGNSRWLKRNVTTHLRRARDAAMHPPKMGVSRFSGYSLGPNSAWPVPQRWMKCSSGPVADGVCDSATCYQTDHGPLECMNWAKVPN